MVDLAAAIVLKFYFYGEIHLENILKAQFLSLLASMLSLCFLECKWSSQYVLGNKSARATKGVSLCFKNCILGYGS